MSQWLDMVAENTIGQSTQVDTSGVSLDSITLGKTPAAPSGTGVTLPGNSQNDKIMLWLTAAGVLFAGLAYYGGRK